MALVLALQQHAADRLEPIDRRDVPDSLEKLIQYLMAKRRNLRTSSASKLVEELARFVPPAQQTIPVRKVLTSESAFRAAIEAASPVPVVTSTEDASPKEVAQQEPSGNNGTAIDIQLGSPNGAAQVSETKPDAGSEGNSPMVARRSRTKIPGWAIGVGIAMACLAVFGVGYAMFGNPDQVAVEDTDDDGEDSDVSVVDHDGEPAPQGLHLLLGVGELPRLLPDRHPALVMFLFQTGDL